jgi:hypothetical protein
MKGVGNESQRWFVAADGDLLLFNQLLSADSIAFWFSRKAGEPEVRAVVYLEEFRLQKSDSAVYLGEIGIKALLLEMP